MSYIDYELQRLAQTSVLQHWVMALPRRHQGVLISGSRGCDITPKPVVPGAGPVERHLVAYLRATFMVPADAREVEFEGAFMRPDPPEPGTWKPSELGHLPLHFFTHLMHAFQVVMECHPQLLERQRAGHIYHSMVHSLHLEPETTDRFHDRLTEDRIASGTVVS